MLRKITIGLSFISVCLAQAHQPPYSFKQQLSMNEAEQLLLKNNAQLKLKYSEVAVAQANVTQKKVFDNPQISIAHNINNPVTHHYFDLGSKGETDVQLSQRIYIGGQHMNGVRKSIAELSGTEADLDNGRRIILHDLREKMIDINALYEKNALNKKKITSLQKILSIYETQANKGNIPTAEVTRMKALLFQATKDREGDETDMFNAQKEIQILLGLGNVEIVPVINESKMLSQAVLLQDTTSIFKNIYGRGDIRQSESKIEVAQHEIQLQKSNTLPEINITGEWDKNGNIGHNYFDVGVNLSIPIFNRNKGNIRAAQEAQNQAIINRNITIDNAKAEVRQAYATIYSLHQLDLSDKNMNELDKMMDNATTQYIHRNISLLEFVDYYSSYKDTKTSIIDSRCQLLQAANDLRTAINQ
jgi:cobalt-zinc-cadmium efflux system outer membrane protein